MAKLQGLVIDESVMIIISMKCTDDLNAIIQLANSIVLTCLTAPCVSIISESIILTRRRAVSCRPRS